MPPLELTDPASPAELLAAGELEVLGRMQYSSNATFLARVVGDGATIPAVYKPRRGERPLWDFPTGTLCQREVATYELAKALGWDLIPATVLRDGPLGEGMVQRFVDHDPEEHYFTLLEKHADRFRRFAVFDVLVNNADRKGGHCLRSRPDGAIVGIDHGLTFHPAWKLRTVIWDFAGERVDPVAAEGVCRVAQLDAGVVDALTPLLSPLELEAMQQRAAELLTTGTLPEPDPGYHSVPWPLV
ncbi:MAG TPA: SCO1664 family protein [Acidimicrobiia bacterium]|nr:SCO1664 family protein [Acidimicrobiia bacterium]